MSKVFHWKAGSLLDQVNDNLLLNTGVVFKQTEKGMAGHFDGLTRKYIDCGDVGNYTDNFTIVSFIKTPKKNSRIFSRRSVSGTQYDTYIHDINGTVAIYDGSTVHEGNAVDLADNQWHMIAFVINGASSRIYNDIDYKIFSPTITYYNQNAWIGAYNTASASYIKGYIKDVIIFNHALSHTEIEAEYVKFLNSHPLAAKKTNIYYPKPTDLSNENGLIAAYNMIPQAGELVDISGNGNNGTINGALSSKNGMNFDGVKDYINIDSIVPDIISTTKGTWIILISVKDSTPSVTQRILNFGDTDNDTYIDLKIYTTGVLRIYFRNTGSFEWTLNTDNSVFIDNEIISIALVQDGVFPVIYINGIIVAQTFSIETDKTAWFNDLSGIDNGRIGCYNANNTGNISFIDGFISDMKIYNRALSLQEIQAYHNQYAKQISFIEDFKYAPADGTNLLPKGWLPGTGSFKISELTADDAVLTHLKKGTKHLEQTSNGAIASLNKQAYGTYEFDINKAALNNLFGVSIINSGKGAYSDIVNGGNKYALLFWSNGVMYLGRQAAGTSSITVLFVTSANYILPNVNYGIKTTRDLTGKFSVYIRGGNYGSQYILVTPSSGNNPATDNVYTISKYTTVQSSGNDKITNIKYSKGIEI